MTIGQLAGATGVPASTLRFWERKGLIGPDHRAGGKRRYTDAARLRVALLRQGQQAGLTVAELRALVAIRSDGWKDLLRVKLVDVERRLAELETARVMLTHAVDCTHDDLMTCPVFRRRLEAFASAQPGVSAEVSNP